MTMTEVYNLNEIPCSVAELPRKFRVIPNNHTYMDFDKAVMAKTFNGQLVTGVEGHDIFEDAELVEVYFDGGVHHITLYTKEIEDMLLGKCDLANKY